MEQKTLARWLKGILAGVGLCGILVYALVLPELGLSLKARYPEFANRFWPWMIFLWATGIPCFLVLADAWKIAGNIGKDRSFSEDNAALFQRIAAFAAGDAGFFFAGNLILLLLDMSHPSVVLFSLIVVFAGVAVAVAAAVLSHLVKKAALLQEQSDWTI